jgi:hypothetical protein
LRREGTPLCRGNLVEKPPDEPIETRSLVGGRNFCCVRGGRRVTFLDHHKLGTMLSQSLWWYHGLERGCHVVGSDYETRPKVGRRGILSQLVGFGNSLITQFFIFIEINFD